jgi:hypothetical protein
VPGGLAAYRPQLRYLLVDEGRLPQAALEQVGNVASAVFRLEWAPRPEALRAVLGTLAAELAGDEDRDLRDAFGTWLDEVLVPLRWPGATGLGIRELLEDKPMLKETAAEWTQEWLEQGREQGLEQGRKQGEAAVLRRQLERRFGSLPPTVSRRLEAAESDELLRWADRVLSARTLEDVFGD